MRISRTPGAAVATKSKAFATGPIRPITGTRAIIFKYSLSEASVSIDIAVSRALTSRP